MRYVILAILAVCAHVAWAEESEPTELSRTAQRTVAKMDGAIEGAFADFSDEIAQIKKKYLKELNDELGRLTRACKLEEALVLKAEIEKIEAATPVQMIPGPTDFLGQPVVSKHGGIQITEATYGARDTYVDVKDFLMSKVANGVIDIGNVHDTIDKEFKPILYGVPKTLVVKYIANGTPGISITRFGDPLVIGK